MQSLSLDEEDYARTNDVIEVEAHGPRITTGSRYVPADACERNPSVKQEDPIEPPESLDALPSSMEREPLTLSLRFGGGQHHKCKRSRRQMERLATKRPRKEADRQEEEPEEEHCTPIVCVDLMPSGVDECDDDGAAEEQGELEGEPADEDAAAYNGESEQDLEESCDDPAVSHRTRRSGDSRGALREDEIYRGLRRRQLMSLLVARDEEIRVYRALLRHRRRRRSVEEGNGNDVAVGGKLQRRRRRRA